MSLRLGEVVCDRPRACVHRGPRFAPGSGAFWLACSLLWLCSISITAPALAHAPPLGARVLWAESGQRLIVTNRGLVFRDTATGLGRLLCNEALGITTGELPHPAFSRDGSLLVATSRGLRSSRDQGCNWSGAGQMGGVSTSALATDPTDPDTVYMATNGPGVTALHVSRDAGLSWSEAHALADGDYVWSILVAAVDPAHVYATVTTFEPSTRPQHALLRTSDRGGSWERLMLPLRDADYMAMAAATHPDDPDMLVMYTVAKSPGVDASQLLVSRDGGTSIVSAFQHLEIRSVAYGERGALWIAARDGLYRADDRLATFEQVSAASELGCVAEHAGELFVCGHYAGVGAPAFGVGSSDNGGESFERWVDFADVHTPVACAANSATSAVCAEPWLDWSKEILADTPMAPLRADAPPSPTETFDAGRPSAPAPGERGPTAPAACVMTPLGTANAGGSWLALAAIAGSALRRRRAPGRGRRVLAERGLARPARGRRILERQRRFFATTVGGGATEKI